MPTTGGRRGGKSWMDKAGARMVKEAMGVKWGRRVAKQRKKTGVEEEYKDRGERREK